MPRLVFRNFGAGLWLAGPTDQAPETTLRRCKGVHPQMNASIRSRWPHTLMVNGLSAPPHTLGRFNDVLVYGQDDKVTLSGSPAVSGFNGNRLRLVGASPTPGSLDYLFITGGGAPKKLSVAGALSDVGLIAPTAGAVNTIAQNLKTIDTCDSSTGWSGPSIALDGTVKLEGAFSLRFTLPTHASSPGTEIVRTGLSLDLSTFGAVTSPDEDWIYMAVRFEKPGWINALQITFADSTTYNNTYTRVVTIDDNIVREKRKKGKKRRGLADVPGVTNNEKEFIGAGGSGTIFAIQAADLLGDTFFHAEDNTWAVLRLPKNGFVKTGSPNWNNITTIRLFVQANRRATATSLVYFDDFKMIGGTGTQGTYKYRFTTKNTTTGSRSDPSDEVVKEDIARQSLTVNRPTAYDSQSDVWETWRTLGNGTEFFFVTEQPIATTSFTDDYADFSGLHTSSDKFLSSTVLDFDNTKPAVTLQDCEGPHFGIMFWCRDTAAGAAGRVYYSPAGRLEAIDGYLTITEDQDSTQRLIIWDSTLFCFTQKYVFEIIGNREPFIARRVENVPGTLWPHTVIATDVGIVYRSSDGIRLFNGNQSILMSDGPLGHLLLGETVEDLEGFAPIFGSVGPEGEGFFSEEEGITLAYHPRDKRWRNVGTALNALFYDKENGILYGSRRAGVFGDILRLEHINSTFNEPRTFEIEVGHGRTDAVAVGVAQRLYFDINTSGEQITPTVFLTTEDGVTTKVLPTVVTNSRRTVEIPINEFGRLTGIRLNGTLATGMVEVFGIEADVYVVE